MKLLLDLPEIFKEHFDFDKFQDSFMRICGDIEEISNSHNNPTCESKGLSGNYEKELVDALKIAFKNAIEPEDENKPHSDAIFTRMYVDKNDWSSGYGTDGENCIGDFASNITYCHSNGKYWKLEKDGKMVAREALYQGVHNG